MDNYQKNELFELIKKDESIFDFIQKSTLDGLWYWDLEKPENEWMNPRFWKILGFNPQEMPHLSSAWQNIINPDDLKLALDNFTRHVKDPNHHYDQVVRYTHKNGSTVWIRCRGMLICDEHGKPVRMLGAHHDITGLKKTEQELRAAREKIEEVSKNWISTFDAIGDIIILLSPNHDIIEINKAGLNSLNKIREEVIGKKCYHLIHNTNAPIKNCPCAYSIKDKNVHVNEYFENNRTYELTSYPMLDEKKNIKALTHIIKDITHRKEADAEIREREVQYRNLANSGKALIWTAGTDKLCNYFNEPWLRYTGRSLEQEMGNGWAEGVHSDDLGQCIKTYVSAFDKREAFDMEYRLRHVSGEYKWIRDMGTPNYNSKKEFIGYIGHCFDISERKQEDEKLKHIASNLADAERIGNTGSWDYDVDTDEAVWSENMFKIFDVDKQMPRELVFKHFIENLVHPDDQANLISIFQDALIGKRPYDIEYRTIRKDGSIIYIHALAETIFNNQGKAYRLVGKVEDITKRKKAEKALMESEMKYRSLVETAQELVWKCDANARFTYLNPAWEKTHGYTLDEMLGKSFSEFQRPEIFERDLIEFSRHMAGGYVKEYETNHLAKDGRELTLLFNAIPVIDFNGNIIGTQGTAVDITERKLAEKKLQESEKYLKETQIIANLGTYTMDITSGKWVSSEVLDSIFGIDPDFDRSIEGWASIIHPEWQKIMTDYFIHDVIGNKTKFNKEYKIIRISDKEERWLHGIGDLKFNDSNQPVNMIGTISDITERKQAEEAISSKNKELENYLSVASHDLRSPLVNILGFSKRFQTQSDSLIAVLNECRLEDKTKLSIDKIANEGIPKTLNFINSNIMKMDGLIKGLLQISRTGRINMTIKKMDMNRLINSIITDQDFQLNELAAEVIVDDLQNCYGDESQLNQMFTNIIGNALKYHDKDRKLIMKIASQTHYNKVIYSISDSGIGIAPRHLEKIWNIFYRVDSASLEAGEGIGLSLAKKITEKHKGKIWAESEEGVGSTFYVELQKNEFAE